MTYALAVLVVGLLATDLSIRVLRRFSIVDVPNHRSSHNHPTIRGAGVGVALCGVGAALLSGGAGMPELWTIAIFAGAFAALGLVDDLQPLGVAVRLPSQVLLAAVAVTWVLPPAGWGLVLLAVVFVVGYVNAFNFMDGINGISALHAAAVGLTWAIAGGIANEPAAVFLGGVAAAAALAFLPFNLPTARAFLGDVGSYFFGGWLAISVVILFGRLPLAVLVLPILPYVADTAWTLLRRMRRGETWHEAHREHVYQRLVRSGWNHLRTSSTMGGLTLACGLLGVVAAQAEGALAVIPVGLAITACVVYLMLPKLIAEPVLIDA